MRQTVGRVLLAAALMAPSAAAWAEFTVSATMVEDRKAVFGTVESIDATSARARIAGTVVELAVDEGSRVAAGARIAFVRDPKLDLERAALDAKLAALDARLALARIDLERARQLRISGNISQARLDQAETEYNVVEAEIAALKAERSVVVESHSEGAVLAPRDGRVLRVRVTTGSVVLPGETVAEIAADAYILRLYLPERHARFIEAGDTVLVGARGLAADSPELRQGTVRQVYPELEGGRVVADVAVAGLGDFFVGERVRVWVGTGERRTFIVPPEYVFYRFGLSYVRLADGAEVVVQSGEPRAEGVEILAGVREGDVLARP